jgi:hypothetical protein
MSSILDLLSSTLGGGAVNQIGDKLGLDPATTGKIVSAAIPLLVTALAKNSSTPQGAQSLHTALSNDHDGSVLDDVMGFLGSAQGGGAGAGILKHVLGNKQEALQAGLGQSTGVDPSSVGQILEMVAPMVMGALGRQAQQSGMDAGGLTDFLQGQAQSARQAQPDVLGSVLGMLDTNKDGSVLDDVGGLLGKLFGKK